MNVQALNSRSANLLSAVQILPGPGEAPSATVRPPASCDGFLHQVKRGTAGLLHDRLAASAPRDWRNCSSDCLRSVISTLTPINRVGRLCSSRCNCPRAATQCSDPSGPKMRYSEFVLAFPRQASAIACSTRSMSSGVPAAAKFLISMLFRQLATCLVRTGNHHHPWLANLHSKLPIRLPVALTAASLECWRSRNSRSYGLLKPIWIIAL